MHRRQLRRRRRDRRKGLSNRRGELWRGVRPLLGGRGLTHWRLLAGQQQLLHRGQPRVHGPAALLALLALVAVVPLGDDLVARYVVALARDAGWPPLGSRVSRVYAAVGELRQVGLPLLRRDERQLVLPTLHPALERPLTACTFRDKSTDRSTADADERLVVRCRRGEGTPSNQFDVPPNPRTGPKMVRRHRWFRSNVSPHLKVSQTR
jgi:hypothetical protein